MMGTAIARRRFLRRRQASYTRPLVFCCEVDGFTDNAVSVSVSLAKRLADVSLGMRSLRVEQCLNDVLRDLPDGVVVCDIDVLFNPVYKIDVLSVLLSAYRKHHFDLIWPGRYEDGELVYAEEGYPDNQSFDIAHYDLTCIY